MAETVKVKVVARPGLADLLEADQPVDRAELDRALGEFLESTGVKGSPVHEAINIQAAEAASGTGQAPDWWRSLKEWWTGEEHRVAETEERPIELAAYWLTLPPVQGASVTMTSSSSNAKEVSASLSIAGIGGGPTLELSVEEEVSFEGEADERASLTVKATFEKVDVLRAGQVVGTYVRLRSVDGDDFTWTRNEEQPPSASSLGPESESREFDFTKTHGSGTQKITIAKGTSLEVGFDLKLWGIGVKLGGKVTYKEDVSYANKLPAGHLYRASRYEDFPARLWEVVA
jgi:hypothetical protein